MNKLFLLILLVSGLARAEFSSIGGQEGTAIKSTGVSSGLVPIAQGDGKTAWGPVESAAGGDVAGPSSSVDNQVPSFDGTTGKLIQSPAGSDANNFFKIDFTNTGEEAFLQSNANHAVTYLVGNTNSGSNARAIISFGNDTGDNRFSIGSTSSGYTAHPWANVAIWSSSFTNGSVFRNIDPAARPFKFIAGDNTSTQALFETIDSTGAFKINGISTTSSLLIDPNALSILSYNTNINAQTTSNFKNANTGSNTYSEVDVSGNSGSLLLGHSSTGVAGSWIEGDQAYVVSNNSKGLMVGTINSDLKFIVGGTSAAQERMRIRENGIKNMPLPNYANDAAAGAAGLVVGDLYQTSGVVMIKQ